MKIQIIHLEEQNKLLAASKDKETQSLYESKIAYTKLQQENVSFYQVML